MAPVLLPTQFYFWVILYFDCSVPDWVRTVRLGTSSHPNPITCMCGDDVFQVIMNNVLRGKPPARVSVPEMQPNGKRVQ